MQLAFVTSDIIVCVTFAALEFKSAIVRCWGLFFTNCHAPPYVTFIDLWTLYSTSVTDSFSFVTPRLSRTLSNVASAICLTHTRAADEKCILHTDMTCYLGPSTPCEKDHAMTYVRAIMMWRRSARCTFQYAANQPTVGCLGIIKR